MVSLLERLRQRRLFQWTLAYVAGGWALLQVLDFAADNFEWPATVVRSATVFVIVGLIPMAVLCWYFGGVNQVLSARGRRVRALVTTVTAALPLLAATGWHAARAESNTPERVQGEFAVSNIAVLYFRDRSADGGLDHLASGITESLIDELSGVAQLKVISANGVAAFRDDVPPPKDVAKALKVGTLVTGTVGFAGGGSRLRVDVQFIDALTGEQIDRTRIEVPRDDVVAVQDSVSREVSLFLRGRLGKQIQQLTSRAGTRSNEAWLALQRARATTNQVDTLLGAGSIDAAIALRLRADSQLAAVEALDPTWTRPLLERGWLAWRVLRGLLSAPDTALINIGLAHAERVLSRDAADFEAHELRATLRYWQWLNNLAPSAGGGARLFAAAEEDFLAATADPRPRASAWNSLSHLLINKGQLAQAKLAAERAYNTDPWLANVDRTLFRLTDVSIDLGITDEAERWCAEARTRFPADHRSVRCQLLVMALPQAKPPDLNRAWALQRQLTEASPAGDREYYRLYGRIAVALALARAGMPDSASSLAASSIGDATIDPRADLINLAAIVQARAGKTDQALQYLARYLAANPQVRGTVVEDQSWWWRDLHNDPRYQRLVSH